MDDTQDKWRVTFELWDVRIHLQANRGFSGLLPLDLPPKLEARIEPFTGWSPIPCTYEMLRELADAMEAWEEQDRIMRKAKGLPTERES